ncbi:hypothetical protein ACN9OX_13030, partial [Glaesserella parasuis]|uniref:hypothetical protein n=1 Tax=Glaesserella parasuis TaxID=738 RepID=UPI003B676022
RMSPLPVIGTLHPFSSTPRGQTCKLLYDEINSVSLSKHLLGVSDAQADTWWKQALGHSPIL